MGQIYKITHKETNKCYIGQTKMSLEWRLNNAFCGHYIHAFSDTNNKSYFHSALRKHGKEAFTYEVIEECDNDKLNEREIYWIAHYKSNIKEFGYNMTKGGKYTNIKFRQKRLALPVETRQKISGTVKKLWEDISYREKVAASKKNNTSITKYINMSNAMKAKWCDIKYHEKMKTIRQQQTTEEFKQKVSAGAKRRWQDPEYREKMKAIRKKQAQRVNSSPEYKQAMSLASKRAWEKRKSQATGGVL